MLEVGQFFNKNGALLGVLDIIKLDDKDFIFMSIEKNKKLDYKFYSVIYSKETNNHELTLVSDEDLYKDGLHCDNVNFQVQEDIVEPTRALCKIRYKDNGEYGILSKEENGIYKFKFDKKVRAIARGQSAVFYIDDKILCGGIIKW